MKRIVLVGAGHAHLNVLKHAAEFRRRDIELSLIAPESFWYSGLATGMLGGTYAPELDRIDVATLITRGGGHSIRDRIAGVDAGRKTVHLASGESLLYDVLSLDLGSEPRPIPGSNTSVYAVKPISNLWRLHRDVVDLIEVREKERLKIIVVGGGATGCEIAANLITLGKRTGAVPDISLLTRGNRLLASSPRAAGNIVSRVLAERGAKIFSDADVRLIENKEAVTTDGRRFSFDLAVNATGLAPSPALLNTGLANDASGALIVDRFLRSVDDSSVFGGGDCIAFEGKPLPKLGVYAVREAPILFRNLLATAEGRPLQPYRPQRQALTILNLGDGTGLAIRGGMAMRGRLFGWLKDRIDRGFLARYRTD